MATKARNYKQEYKTQQARGENSFRAKRAAARRAYDKAGISRDGKDIAHIKALSHGGSTKMSNTKLQAPSKNRSFARTKSGAMKR
jgi:hypothetical protein